MSTLLGNKNVGDIVKINENNKPIDYIIVHKGIPDAAIYDKSCDGIWVMRQRGFGSTDFSDDDRNDYENSSANAWLNSTFLNTIEAKIRDVIKNVKIPYKKGVGTDEPIKASTGENGLSCKVFLLSLRELCSNLTELTRTVIDGAILSYFSEEGEGYASQLRSCQTDKGVWLYHYLRTVHTDSTKIVKCINGTMSGYNGSSDANRDREDFGIRPAFILPSTILVQDDDTLSLNTLPGITADKSGDLGMLTDGFDVSYSVDDEDDEDELIVTKDLDGTIVDSYTAEKKQSRTYSLRGEDWLKVANGSHTFRISVTDGKDTTEHTVAFSRDQTSAFVTLQTPMEADDLIRFCSLAVEGVFPTDALLTCEVTNNALDDELVWEDCTLKVLAGLAYTFKNKFAEKGFAFSFRVTIERGRSGMGGYITKLYGGFE